MKYCSKCEETKENADFHKMTRSADGLQNWCKVCLRADNKRMEQYRYQNGPTIHRNSKTCQRCKSIKPVSQFPKKRSSADGFTSYCKPCWVIKIQSYQRKAKGKI